MKYHVYLAGHVEPIATVEGDTLQTEDVHLRRVWDSRPKLTTGANDGDFFYTETRDPKTPAERAGAFVDLLGRIGMIVREVTP